MLRAAGIAPGTPLIRINTAAVARRVEQITQIQSAQVSRDWPDSVVIAIRERTPALAVASGGGYALIDRFGVVVGHVARRPPADGPAGLGPGRPGFAARQPGNSGGSDRAAPASAAVRGLVRAVAAPSANAVTLDLQRGITVLWGGTDRPAAKAAELTILMRTKASFYDLGRPGHRGHRRMMRSPGTRRHLRHRAPALRHCAPARSALDPRNTRDPVRRG